MIHPFFFFYSIDFMPVVGSLGFISLFNTKEIMKKALGDFFILNLVKLRPTEERRK